MPTNPQPVRVISGPALDQDVLTCIVEAPWTTLEEFADTLLTARANLGENMGAGDVVDVVPDLYWVPVLDDVGFYVQYGTGAVVPWATGRHDDPDCLLRAELRMLQGPTSPDLLRSDQLAPQRTRILQRPSLNRADDAGSWASIYRYTLPQARRARGEIEIHELVDGAGSELLAWRAPAEQVLVVLDVGSDHELASSSRWNEAVDAARRLERVRERLALD